MGTAPEGSASEGDVVAESSDLLEPVLERVEKDGSEEEAPVADVAVSEKESVEESAVVEEPGAPATKDESDAEKPMPEKPNVSAAVATEKPADSTASEAIATEEPEQPKSEVVAGIPEIEASEPESEPKPVQNRKTHYQAALKLIEVARMDEAFPRMLEDVMKPFKMELRNVPPEFWTGFVETADYTAVRKALADRYVAEFSQSEIEELTTFYGSPVGRKLVERNLEIQRIFSIDSREWVKKTKALLTRQLRAKSYMY